MSNTNKTLKSGQLELVSSKELASQIASIKKVVKAGAFPAQEESSYYASQTSKQSEAF